MGTSDGRAGTSVRETDRLANAVGATHATGLDDATSGAASTNPEEEEAELSRADAAQQASASAWLIARCAPS